jgi:hypothetical protein
MTIATPKIDSETLPVSGNLFRIYTLSLLVALLIILASAAGLIVLLLLRPFLIGIPFDLSEFLAVAGLSLFCFVPFGLYLRGVLKGNRQ